MDGESYIEGNAMCPLVTIFPFPLRCRLSPVRDWCTWVDSAICCEHLLLLLLLPAADQLNIGDLISRGLPCYANKTTRILSTNRLYDAAKRHTAMYKSDHTGTLPWKAVNQHMALDRGHFLHCIALCTINEHIKDEWGLPEGRSQEVASMRM